MYQTAVPSSDRGAVRRRRSVATDVVASPADSCAVHLDDDPARPVRRGRGETDETPGEAAVEPRFPGIVE